MLKLYVAMNRSYLNLVNVTYSYFISNSLKVNFKVSCSVQSIQGYFKHTMFNENLFSEVTLQTIDFLKIIFHTGVAYSTYFVNVNILSFNIEGLFTF